MFLKVSEYTQDVCGGVRERERERIGKTTWHIPYLYSKMLYVPTCAMLTIPKNAAILYSVSSKANLAKLLKSKTTCMSVFKA